MVRYRIPCAIPHSRAARLMPIGCSLDPIVNTAIHEHAEHVFGFEVQFAVAEDAKSPAHVMYGLLGDRLNPPLIEIRGYGPQPFVSFNIRSSEREECAHFCLLYTIFEFLRHRNFAYNLLYGHSHSAIGWRPREIRAGDRVGGPRPAIDGDQDFLW